MDPRKQVEQRAAHLGDAADIAAHPPGVGVVTELAQVSAQWRHREVACQKARQRQHRMAVAARRTHQERRQQKAGVELENAPRFGKEKRKARRTKPGRSLPLAPLKHAYFFLSPPSAPSPVMLTNISCIRSANLGSKLNQLWTRASGDTLSRFAVICCCSLSMTAVCIGATSGSPKNCRASRGVQSISMFTFMSAPWISTLGRADDRVSQYRHDGPLRASGSTRQMKLWSTQPFFGQGRSRRLAGFCIKSLARRSDPRETGPKSYPSKAYPSKAYPSKAYP